MTDLTLPINSNENNDNENTAVVETTTHTGQTSHAEALPDSRSVPDKNARILNAFINDIKTPWQVHNCKITEQLASQDLPLPFLYHYDSLADDIKKTYPLTPALLKQFNTPMTALEAAKLIGVDPVAIATPWQVKIMGTLVLFCEPLQIALRLKFTNTAKDAEAIYTKDKADAITKAMENWHFYGDVFVANKNAEPLIVLDEKSDNWLSLPQAAQYQPLPATFSLALLSDLETAKAHLPIIDEAIEQRIL